MTQGQNGARADHPPPPRPPSSAHSSSHSSGSSSKHVKCIGRYVLTGHTLGKGNFARVEAAVHSLTGSKVSVFGYRVVSCLLLSMGGYGRWVFAAGNRLV